MQYSAVVYYINTANPASQWFNLRHHDCPCFIQSLLIKYIRLVVCRLTKLTEDIELTIIYQCSAFSPVFIPFLSYIVVLPCPVMHVLVFLFPCLSILFFNFACLCISWFTSLAADSSGCLSVTGINESPSLSSSDT